MASVVRAALRFAELAVVGLLGLLLTVASVGWLYIIRSDFATPGPRIGDALPLDELAGHATVEALVLLAVWSVAAVLFGLVASVARIERLTAAFLFALGVGVFLYASTGVSILVVRQIGTDEAFQAAGHVQPVYIAAALAGLGGAALGVRRSRIRRRAPLLLATFVAISGLLDVASAVTPAVDARLRLIEDATPYLVPKIASALVVPTGLALVVLARGLSRRQRRAWQLTLALVLAAATMHLLKGLDYEEASANILLALALVARRHDFAGRGDPSVRVHLLGRLALYTTAIFAYGATAIWVNRAVADRPYTLGFALRETGRSLAGLTLSGHGHLGDRFGDWFPFSVLIAGLLAAFSLLWAWLAPWRYRLRQGARERIRAQALVDAFGIDTLAPFALRRDKSYFFSEDERAFLAYRVVAGVAVVSGDPVGPPDAVAPLLPQYLAFARERNWRVAVLGAGERYLDLYREHGLHVLYHGDEAVVQVRDFSLDGRAIRKVRQSVSRLERQGYRIEILWPEQIRAELCAELEEIADEWRGGAPQKGFTMELDTLFRLEGRDALFVIGREPDGRPMGFLHFVVVHAGGALSLSSMPRRPGTPNGFNEWLVVETLVWAKAHAFERVSLNFAPFAALFESQDEELDRRRRLGRRALRALKGHGFQLENLLDFNRKFFPRWEHRYVVYERTVDLPRVGIAGLAAEGYLPLEVTRS